MTAGRSMRDEGRYRKAQRTRDVDTCPFCSITENDSQYIDETASFKVIRNTYPYTVWDGQGVVDHLMIVPKKHTDTLGDIGTEAAAEYIKLIELYEKDGYNFYARAPQSNIKTVHHQHTHLIKLDGKHREVFLYMRRPYVRLSR